MCLHLCGHSSARCCAWLRVAGPLCGGKPLPRNAGGKVGLQERGVSRYSRQFLGTGVCGVPRHSASISSQVAVRVCAVRGCERGVVCAKPGACGLRSVYMSAEGSSGACATGRRVKPLREASSVPVGHGREMRRCLPGML